MAAEREGDGLVVVLAGVVVEPVDAEGVLERAFNIVGALFLWYGYEIEHGHESTVLEYLQRQALLNEEEPD